MSTSTFSSAWSLALESIERTHQSAALKEDTTTDPRPPRPPYTRTRPDDIVLCLIWKGVLNSSLQSVIRGFFWTFWKKLKLKKTQNSSKIHKNSSKNSKKTQKPPTSLEFSWRKIFKHHNFWPQSHYSIFNIWPTNINHKTNISLLLQWLTIPSNFWSDFITALITVNWKEKLKGILVKKLKTQAKFRKKLKPKSKKTQKPPTPVEMSCQKNVQKKPLYIIPVSKKHCNMEVSEQIPIFLWHRSLQCNALQQVGSLHIGSIASKHHILSGSSPGKITSPLPVFIGSFFKTFQGSILCSCTL